MPRFETAAEREERQMKEVELARFGEVTIAFRLTTLAGVMHWVHIQLS